MSYPQDKAGDRMDARTLALAHRHADQLPPLDAYPVRQRRFPSGERLAVAGEPLERLCFVVEGCAAVYNLMANGGVALLTEYRGVQTIGELEFLMGYPTLTSDIRALSKGAMLCIPLAQAREQLLADPVMLAYLGREVARKLERSSRLVAQDRLYPLASRLAAYLLYAQRGQRAQLHLTRLSELMGTSYRHLLRTLHTFCDEGLIGKEQGGYRLLDVETLARLGCGIRYD